MAILSYEFYNVNDKENFMKREEHLDILRVTAVILVMFGHFVSVGSFAKIIPLIINEKQTLLPLIDNTNWNLWKVEIFIINYFSTQTAILGVSIFFIITGYLMAVMMERYSRSEFLVNRFFRIFPTLIFSTIFLSVFVYFTQSITFEIASYLASWTLTYQYL